MISYVFYSTLYKNISIICIYNILYSVMEWQPAATIQPTKCCVYKRFDVRRLRDAGCCSLLYII